jgi:hypothetical protein
VKELLDLSFSPVNLFLSVMSLLLILYWLLVIAGATDPDYFSIEFDGAPDVDADITTVDVENPTGKSVQSNGNGDSPVIEILRFFHFDELPLMLILTLVFFTMWLLSINISWYFGIENPLIGVLLYIPYFIGSLFVVKIFSKPLIYLYKFLNHKGEEEIDFLGRRCRVVNAIGPASLGTVELLVKGDPIKIYAKSNNGEPLTAGTEALIVNESVDKKYFLVEKFEY